MLHINVSLCDLIDRQLKFLVNRIRIGFLLAFYRLFRYEIVAENHQNCCDDSKSVSNFDSKFDFRTIYIKKSSIYIKNWSKLSFWSSFLI